MKTFSIKKAYKSAWKSFWEQPVFLIAIMALGMILNGLGEVLQQSVSSQGLSIAIMAIGIVATLVYWAGAIKINIKVTRKEQTDWIDFKPNWKVIGMLFLVNVVTAIITLFGFIALIIPGFMAIIALIFTSLITIDHPELGLREIIKSSLAITKGVRWKLLLMGISTLGVMLLGLLAIGLGLFIAIPVLYLAAAWVYDELKKQTDLKEIMGQ